MEYTIAELKRLEEEENELTNEAIAAMLLLLKESKGDLEKELRNFYSTYGKDGVITYQEARKWISSSNHTRRLFALNSIIADSFDESYKAFGNALRSHLEEVVLKEARFFGITLDVDDILNTPWGVDDLTWLERLIANQNKQTLVFGNDIKLSILKKDSILEVLEQAAKRGESMEFVLKRLWRTESNAISSISRKRIYEELGIREYRFIHIDKCGCEECNDMDGRIFPLSEYVVGVTANPLHPHCRDTTVPIIP